MVGMMATPWEATWAICSAMFAPMVVWMVMIGIYHIYEYFRTR